jgi:hypothetical protein
MNPRLVLGDLAARFFDVSLIIGEHRPTRM